MPLDLRAFMADQVKASKDPTGMFRAAIRSFQGQQEGDLTTISTSSPVLQVLETSSAQVGAFLQVDERQTQKQYATAAKTREDLYPHMATKHFTNIFTLPSKTNFILLFNKNELLNRMQPVPGTRSRKITIPRNSYFTIAGLTFGIHYPIDIIQQSHEALRVVWDMDQRTPLQDFQSNRLKFDIRRRDDEDHLAIVVPVSQFRVLSKSPAVTPSRTFLFNQPITGNEKFYACRVWQTLDNGQVEEIKVTYSESTYDVEVPTAVVYVTDSGIQVKIPQIYLTTGKIKGEVRIDTYVTQGPMETRLDGYAFGSIIPKWFDLNKRASTTFTAGMDRLATKLVLAPKPVTGGANAMTFEELRTAVIGDEIGDPNQPITPAQIQNHLVRGGYEIIKNADVVTDRVFLASRNMPMPQDPSLLTSANAAIEVLNASPNELVGRSFVYDNGSSLSITPDAVYQMSNGVLRMLTDSEISDIESLRPELRASLVTRNNYLFSPYYYVADRSRSEFRLAAYHLTSPAVPSISFDDDNETTLFEVNTNGYELIKTKTGYTLRLTVVSNDNYKRLDNNQVDAVLAFIPPGEKDYAYMRGVIVDETEDGERVFDFTISTRYNMNEEDEIDFQSFYMYEMAQKTIYAALTQSCKVFYSTNAAVGEDWVLSEIDALLPRFGLIDNTSKAITMESITLYFGDALNGLWARGRAIAASRTYETYLTDQYLRYTQDVFEINPDNGTTLWFDAPDGVPYEKKLHSAGDIQKDSQGNDIIQYPKGTEVRDADGNPVLKSDRYLKHYMEFFLIEGAYRFTTDSVALDYIKILTETVAYWVVEEIGRINQVTLDNTRVYFYPKTIFGSIDVIVTDGLKRTIDAGQRFDVYLHVPAEVLADTTLLAQLRRQTVLGISGYLDRDLLSNSEMTETLREAYGSDVQDAQVSKFGPTQDIAIMQLVNPVRRCGVRKRLVSRDDERIVVEEDITVAYNTL